jgi:hypothetical protein
MTASPSRAPRSSPSAMTISGFPGTDDVAAARRRRSRPSVVVILDRMVSSRRRAASGRPTPPRLVPPSARLARRKSVLQALGGPAITGRSPAGLTTPARADASRPISLRLSTPAQRAARRTTGVPMPPAAVPQEQWLASIEADAREVERMVLSEAVAGRRPSARSGPSPPPPQTLGDDGILGPFCVRKEAAGPKRPGFRGRSAGCSHANRLSCAP